MEVCILDELELIEEDDGRAQLADRHIRNVRC